MSPRGKFATAEHAIDLEPLLASLVMTSTLQERRAVIAAADAAGVALTLVACDRCATVTTFAGLCRHFSRTEPPVATLPEGETALHSLRDLRLATRAEARAFAAAFVPRAVTS